MKEFHHFLNRLIGLFGKQCVKDIEVRKYDCVVIEFNNELIIKLEMSEDKEYLVICILNNECEDVSRILVHCDDESAQSTALCLLAGGHSVLVDTDEIPDDTESKPTCECGYTSGAHNLGETCSNCFTTVVKPEDTESSGIITDGTELLA